MKHEKKHINKIKKYKKPYFWRFCKITYNEKIERKKQKIIIIPKETIAIQIENDFILQDLKKLKRTPKNPKHIKILETYKYIPAEASEKLINRYIEHQRKRQLKLNSESIIGSGS